MDILIDKQKKSHSRRLGHCKETETESFLIATQNNTQRTNIVKEK